MLSLHARTGLVAALVALAAITAAPATAKPRAAKRMPQQVVCASAVTNLPAAQILENIRRQTGGATLAFLGTKTYLWYPDGSLARVIPCAAASR